MKSDTKNFLISYYLLLLVIIFISSVSGRRGLRKCHTQTGALGTCRPLPDCNIVKQNLKYEKPTICSYKSFFPVVCCPFPSRPTIPWVVLTTPRTPRQEKIDPQVRVLPPVVVKGNPGSGTSLQYPGCGKRFTPQKSEVPDELQSIIAKAFPNRRVRGRRSSRLAALIDRDEPQVQFIVGGKTSNEGSWPWMAAIYVRIINGKLEYKCGGTLINDKYIITAAHCFTTTSQTDARNKYVVRLGRNDRSEFLESDNYSIKRIILHEDFHQPVQYNDIALVELRRRVQVQNNVRPACLPIGIKDDVLADRVATVLGWGSLHFGGEETNNLQEVNVPITTNIYCNESYSNTRVSRSYPNGIISTMLCAGSEQGGKDACLGDSGGPLLILDNRGRWTLGGIISGGHQCARPGIPGIYTRVSSYLQWINKEINN